jgi:hypothetical protein
VSDYHSGFNQRREQPDLFAVAAPNGISVIFHPAFKWLSECGFNGSVEQTEFVRHRQSACSEPPRCGSASFDASRRSALRHRHIACSIANEFACTLADCFRT